MMTTSTRPFVMLVVVATLATIIAVGRPWQPPMKALGFSAETTLSETLVEQGSLPRISLYDDSLGRWIVKGKVAPSIRPFVRDDDPEQIGPDSIRHHVIVRLAPDATADTARRAFLSLASEGICQIGVVPERVASDAAPYLVAGVIRLIEIQDDGRRIACRDRINRR